jgi:hypothetical protein
VNDRAARRGFVVGAAALLVSIVAIFALAAAWQWRAAAQVADDDVLDNAQAVQGELLQLNRDGLLQISKALSANAGFVAYVNRALDDANGSKADVHSIKDQLAQRRGELGLDAIAVLLPSGHLVAAVGEGVPDAIELGRDDRFAAAVASSSATAGFLAIGARTWQVAFSPMIQGGVVVAVLMTGRLHEAAVARDVAALSRAGYALVIPGDGLSHIRAASLEGADAIALSDAIAARRHWPGDALHIAATTRIAGFAAPLRVRAVVDATPGTAWLTIAPVRALAQGSRVFAPLALALIGVLAALAVAMWALWREWIAPLLALANVAEHSAVGNHAIAFAPRGAAAVRRIGQALNRAQALLGRHRPQPDSPRRRSTDRS